MLSTTSSKRLFVLLAGLALGAIALLSGPRAALAVGEQVGRVRGVVTNSVSGDPLEAVTVEATSPALIGGARTTLTNSKGRYEFGTLPPGAYTFTYSYPATQPTSRTITIRLGEAVTLNIAYSFQDEQETVSIVERRQLTKPDSAQTGGVLESETLNRLPTDRTYQGAAQFVPGVTGGDNPNVKGGSSRNNKYLIDGLDVSDPVLSTYATNLTFDSIQAVDTITGGMDAEYNALGGVINVITKGGAEDFHAVASLYYNNQAMSAKGTNGPNLYEGVQPFNDTKVGATQTYQASLNVGGPIIAKKLWYSLTYEFDSTSFSPAKAAPLGVDPYNIQHPPRTYFGQVGRIRLSWAPTTNHRFWISANADPATIKNTDRGNSRLGVAEDQQRQGGFFTIAGWEWTGSEKYTPGIQIGFLQSNLENGPMGWFGSIDKTGCDQFSAMNCTYSRDQPQHINTFDNTTWYQGGPYSVDRRYRLQVDPSVRIRATAAGVHNIKAGVQAQFIRHTWDWQEPGGGVYRDNAGSPLESNLCDPANPGPSCFLLIQDDPFHTHETGMGLGFYVQDRWWTPFPWLTVTPGLRGDYGTTIDYKGRQATSLFALAPRLGFTADLTQDGRNILFGYYGRTTEPISLLVSSDVSTTEASVEHIKQYNPTTKMFEEIEKSGGPGGLTVDPKAKMPHADELTAGFRRELLPNTVGSLEYTWKRIANSWNAAEVNRVWDPSGARVIGYVDPNKPGQQVFFYTTPDDPTWFQSLILSTEGRPTPRWDYGASYTLSWTTFRSTADNFRLQPYSLGYSGADVRHNLRSYGSYNVTDYVLLGGSFQYQTGGPLTKGYYNAQDGDYSNQRGPAGLNPSTANDFKSLSQFRTPDTVQLDVRVSVALLPARLHQRLALLVDVFNVFNLQTPTGITSTDITRFGQVSSRQTPLHAQVALNYAY